MVLLARFALLEAASWMHVLALVLLIQSAAHSISQLQAHCGVFEAVSHAPQLHLWALRKFRGTQVSSSITNTARGPVGYLL